MINENSKIFFTSLVTAAATLIVSPISIWLGFTLNDYLSRPKLEITYFKGLEYTPPSMAELYGAQSAAFLQSQEGLSCRSLVNVLVINKGGTDGLVLGKAIVRVSGQILEATRTSAPKSNRTMIAVPTTVVNEEVFSGKGYTTVGKLPANSMVELWYEVKERPCEDGEMEVQQITLFNASDEEISLKN